MNTIANTSVMLNGEEGRGGESFKKISYTRA